MNISESLEVGTYAHVRDVKEDEAAFEVGTRALILARELVHHAAMKGEDEVMELLSVGSEYDVFATLLDVASNRTLAQGVRALSLDVCLTAVSSRLYCADPNDSILINRVEPRQAATFVQAAFELFCEDTPPQNPLEWITGSGSWVMRFRARRARRQNLAKMLRILGRRRSLHIIHGSDEVLRAVVRRLHGKKRRPSRPQQRSGEAPRRIFCAPGINSLADALSQAHDLSVRALGRPPGAPRPARFPRSAYCISPWWGSGWTKVS